MTQSRLRRILRDVEIIDALEDVINDHLSHCNQVRLQTLGETKYTQQVSENADLILNAYITGIGNDKGSFIEDMELNRVVLTLLRKLCSENVSGSDLYDVKMLMSARKEYPDKELIYDRDTLLNPNNFSPKGLHAEFNSLGRILYKLAAFDAEVYELAIKLYSARVAELNKRMEAIGRADMIGRRIAVVCREVWDQLSDKKAPKVVNSNDHPYAQFLQEVFSVLWRNEEEAAPMARTFLKA